MLLDEGKVNHLMNARVCAEVMDSVADLCRHSNHADIAREYKLQVVFLAVPERAVERFANFMEYLILSAAST